MKSVAKRVDYYLLVASISRSEISLTEKLSKTRYCLVKSCLNTSTLSSREGKKNVKWRRMEHEQKTPCTCVMMTCYPALVLWLLILYLIFACRESNTQFMMRSRGSMNLGQWHANPTAWTPEIGETLIFGPANEYTVIFIPVIS